MIVVIDGPEKAGKSTLIANAVKELNILGYPTRVRKWGQLKTDDREYTPALKEDTNDMDNVVFWDRSWVSEHVYAKLLERDRRLKDNSFLGEFIHRRALFGQGFGFILAPRTTEMIDQYRDDTDLDVDPVQERRMFMQYAVQYKWNGILNDYTPESLDNNTKKIIMAVTSMKARHDQRTITVSPCTGNQLLFVASSLVDPKFPGEWLPFSSERLIKFAEMFGEAALAANWADSDIVRGEVVNQHRFIVTVGKFAEERLKEWKTPSDRNIIKVLIPVPGGKHSVASAQAAMVGLSQQLSGVKRYLLEIWHATKTAI